MKIKQRTNRLEVVEGRKLGLGAENSRCTWCVGYIGNGHAIREKITNRLAQNLQNAHTENVDAVFAVALFNAYENKDLSAFMMAVCNNSVFDLLRNSFLIPIRFNDKGVENPIFLTDENGNLLDESKNHIYEKKYKMFHKLFEEQDEIPDYRMYMADGFRESHGYTQNGEIETIRNAEHTGILLLFEFPQSVDLEINEEKKCYDKRR